MGLSLEEQETNVNFSRESDKAIVYTSDSTMITKLQKLVEISGTEWKLESVSRLRNGEIVGRTYSCPVEFITFRSKRVSRAMTEEQKRAFAERMQKSRGSES